MLHATLAGFDEIDLRQGGHVCAFYRGATDRDRLLTPYVTDGLTAGEKCVCIVDSPYTASQLRALHQEGVSPDAAGSQLDVHLPELTYLAGGGFSPGDMITFWTETLAKAEIDGYPSCRIAGEMTWALRDVPGVGHLAGYESELNRVMSSHPALVLCLYDLDLFSGEFVINVVKTHPQVLVHGFLVQNPYYVEPDEFLRSACA
jgi:hypothetical protein